jgi:pilus assembly protein CpaC
MSDRDRFYSLGHMPPAAWVVGAILFGFGIWPATGADELAKTRKIHVEVDQAEIIPLPQPATTIFVANPNIADVQSPNPDSVIVLGKKAGTTSVYIFSKGSTAARYVIEVGKRTEISSAIDREVPRAAVEVASTPRGVIVSGSVATPRDAMKLKEVTDQYLGDKERATMAVGVSTSSQVNLRVRVAEVSRDVEKRFGFNWNALFNNGTFAVGLLTGRAPVTAFGNFIRDPSTNQLDSLGLGYQSGSANISTLIDALQTEGLMSILSEPNLTATSGEPASFLAGGEFPVPISQGLQQVTVEWKRFGVSVEFTPTVLDASRISVKVKPEVSELSNSGSVTLNNITIPALTVRRAQTTVELASGQSFAIAGLFQNNVQNQVQQMPWLSDLPVLGALFRSTSFQRHESELVIIVTPYIVQPAPKPGDLHLPTENIVFASDLEQLLLGRLTGAQKPSQPSAPAAADQPHLSGAAGFVME